jgi:hypothetical protein
VKHATYFMAVLTPLFLALLVFYRNILGAINGTRQKLGATLLGYADEMDNLGAVDGNQQFVSSFDSN